MAKEKFWEFTIGAARYVKRGDFYGFTIAGNQPIPIKKHVYYAKKREYLKLRKNEVKHGEIVSA